MHLTDNSALIGQCGMGASRFSNLTSAGLVAVFSLFLVVSSLSYKQTSTTRVGWYEALSAFSSSKVTSCRDLAWDWTALDWTGLDWTGVDLYIITLCTEYN